MMRPTTLILCLLSIALLVAPAAMADHGDGTGRADTARAAAHGLHNETRENETADNESAENETHEHRGADANRSALMDKFVAELHALHDSWVENATAIREACHSDNSTIDHSNATHEQRLSWAHCIRDGYRHWRTSHSADLKEIRSEFQALADSMGRGKHHGADS